MFNIFVIFSRWVSQDLITWVTNQVHIPMHLLTLSFISCWELQFFEMLQNICLFILFLSRIFLPNRNITIAGGGLQSLCLKFTLGAPTICSIYQYLHLWSIKVRLSLSALSEQTIIVNFLLFFFFWSVVMPWSICTSIDVSHGIGRGLMNQFSNMVKPWYEKHV